MLVDPLAGVSLINRLWLVGMLYFLLALDRQIGSLMCFYATFAVLQVGQVQMLCATIHLELFVHLLCGIISLSGDRSQSSPSAKQPGSHRLPS